MDTGSNWFDVTTGGGTHGMMPAADSTNELHFFIETGGTSTTWGSLTVNRNGTAALGSATRKISAGAPQDGDTIDFFTWATAGNASAFGSRGTAGSNVAGANNETRGLMFGGWRGHCCSTANNIEFITMDTTGNASSFGTSYAAQNAGASGNDTTSIFFGGSQWFGSGNMYQINNMQFVDINTAGNATEFGNIQSSKNQGQMGSNATRGLNGGGLDSTIGFVTFASLASASTFGIWTEDRSTSCDNGVTCLGMGGSSPSTNCDQITIDTTGNATSFALTFNADLSNTQYNSTNSYIAK